MIIKSTLFGGAAYHRMATVLKHTIEINSPQTPISFFHPKEIDEELVKLYRSLGTIKLTYLANARKTKHHCEIVKTTDKGTLLGLLDADTMVLKDLNCLENLDFDFAYTVRKFKNPINSGVVFMRVSDRIVKWYEQWLANVKHLLSHKKEFIRWKLKYGGINQCGLGMMLEKPHDLKLLQLEGDEWNCTNDMVERYQPGYTRIVHIMGKLRNSVLYKQHSNHPNVLELSGIWRNYEREASII